MGFIARARLVEVCKRRILHQTFFIQTIMGSKRSADDTNASQKKIKKESNGVSKEGEKKSKKESNGVFKEGELVESNCPMPFRLTAPLPTRDKEGLLYCS